ncbi:MAG: DHH family phosphoesterase [Candidatus Thermoplasmatota archaeon]
MLIDALKGKERKLLILHKNADVDAVGSGVALACVFKNIDVGVMESISRFGSRLLEELNHELLLNPKIEDYSSIIAIDTSSPNMLGIKNLEKISIIIDHHTPTNVWKNCIYICDESKSSCAEIIYDIIKEVEHEKTKKIGKALLAGIICDTSFLRYAKQSTLLSIIEIMEKYHVKIDDVFSLFSDQPLEISKKIAALKALQRMRFEVIGKDKIIASSVVSTNESMVANLLLNIGVSLAFVGSQNKENFRISARANIPELHVGKFLAEVGKEFGGEGGGHNGAGGLSGLGDVEAFLLFCMEKAKERLEREALK